MIDWASIPVTEVEISRFAVRLHDIDLDALKDDDNPEPVRAYTRPGDGQDIWTADGRHRVLRALLRGETTVRARVLVIP